MEVVMKLRRNKKGFTLVELIVVIAILAILAAVAAVSVTGVIRKARISTIDSDLNVIKAAYQSYKAEGYSAGGDVPTAADKTAFTNYISGTNAVYLVNPANFAPATDLGTFVGANNATAKITRSGITRTINLETGSIS
ncbi:MAG: prepilin-type N-terminal cleavage/methylation domain-containing protein [Clostridia bacterium]|nr:prepilin-type N-terminal cleavage/methylation domain-containing protein [Clostridia bacterium]